VDFATRLLDIVTGAHCPRMPHACLPVAHACPLIARHALHQENVHGCYGHSHSVTLESVSMVCFGKWPNHLSVQRQDGR
jgi:hypothetical protein